METNIISVIHASWYCDRIDAPGRRGPRRPVGGVRPWVRRVRRRAGLALALSVPAGVMRRDASQLCLAHSSPGDRAGTARAVPERRRSIASRIAGLGAKTPVRAAEGEGECAE